MSKAATMATTRIQTEVEVPDERQLRAWRRLARELVKLFRKLWAAIFGGTVDDLRGDLATAKRVAGKAGDAGVGVMVGVGKGLDVAVKATHGVTSTVGRVLGALLPSQPPGPADVAAAAAAQDDRRTRATDGLRDAVRAELSGAPVAAAIAMPEPKPRPALSPVETVAAIREGLALIAKGDLSAGPILERLPRQIERWVCLLGDAEARRLVALPNGEIFRHVTGVAAVPGLPPIAGTSTTWRLSPSDMQKLVARSVATMRVDEAEISAMAKRPGRAAGPPPDGAALRRGRGARVPLGAPARPRVLSLSRPHEKGPSGHPAGPLHYAPSMGAFLRV